MRVQEITIVITIILILLLSFFGPMNACRIKAGAMQMNYKFGFIAGCMIEPEPGKWVPLENFRAL